jgi:ATP phosphoribosyltransferase
VQSGETLRANGLREDAEIARSTARLIRQTASAAMKNPQHAAISTALIRQDATEPTTKHPHLEQATCAAPSTGLAGPAQ